MRRAAHPPAQAVALVAVTGSGGYERHSGTSSAADCNEYPKNGNNEWIVPDQKEPAALEARQAQWKRVALLVVLTACWSISSAPSVQALAQTVHARSGDRQTLARSGTREKSREQTGRRRLVLPSERAYQESLARRKQRQALVHRTTRVVVPGALLIGGTGGGVAWYLRHRQRRRAAEFEEFLKTTLQDLGGGPDPDDVELEDTDSSFELSSDTVEQNRPSTADPSAVAKRIHDRADLAGRLRVDLSTKPDVVMLDGSTFPSDSLEYRIHRFLSEDATESESSEVDLTESLRKALQDEQWTQDRLLAVSNGSITRIISNAIEEMRRQSQTFAASDFGMQKLLQVVYRCDMLATALPPAEAEAASPTWTSKSMPFAQRLRYAGRQRNRQDVQDLYRRYVIRALMQEQPTDEREAGQVDLSRLEKTMSSLAILERILRIDEASATSIKDEAARFVFQMAVSATFSNPNASVDETYLQDLMKLLEGLLTPEIAERIRSEVGMMRILYDIEKMVKEGNITREDKRALRTLCTQLGFNVQDFLESTAQLKEVLGAEGERYARLFQQIFGDDNDEDGGSERSNRGELSDSETTDTQAVRMDTSSGSP
jgi:hypothetical protein